jgi:hypothetical protein
MNANVYKLDDSDDAYSSARARKIGKTKNLTTRRTLNANMHDNFASSGDFLQMAVVAFELPTLPKLPYLASLLHYCISP